MTQARFPGLMGVGLALGALSATARGAGFGDLDLTFSTIGHTTISAHGYDQGKAMVLQPDGKIVVAGTTSIDDVDYCVVARLKPDGSVDADFGGADDPFGDPGDGVVGVVGGGCNAIIRQPDGKLVVAGYQHRTSGTADDFRLIRLRADGQLDQDFAAAGAAVLSVRDDAQITALALQTDGSLVAGGWAIGATGYSEFALARFDRGGHLDRGYGVNGAVTRSLGPGHDDLFALGLQSDGKVIAAGRAEKIAGASDTDWAMARFDGTGTLDATFGMAGTVVTPIGRDAELHALVILPGDQVLVAGYSRLVDQSRHFTLGRYTAAGAPDLTFGTAGRTVTSFRSDAADVAFAVLRQPDGKLVAGGFARKGPADDAEYDFALARYSADGVPDPLFGTGGHVVTNVLVDDGINAVALQPDGKIVAAGTAIDERGFGYLAVARYFGRGTCGNGVTDPDEQCDDGNVTGGDCCSPQCTLEVAGTVCRAAAGLCDVAEVCSGTSPMCPADARSQRGSVCRQKPDTCWQDALCDGTSVDCPANPFDNAAACASGDGCTLNDGCNDGLCIPGVRVCEVAPQDHVVSLVIGREGGAKLRRKQQPIRVKCTSEETGLCSAQVVASGDGRAAARIVVAEGVKKIKKVGTVVVLRLKLTPEGKSLLKGLREGRRFPVEATVSSIDHTFKPQRAIFITPHF